MKTQSQQDVVDPARARALQATLGRVPDIRHGDPLPDFYHHVYFWDPQPPDRLGRDGHPKTGGLIPDFGLSRRMWAGGALEFHTPVIAGQKAEKRTCLEKAERKQGRSGPLALVTLRHEIWQNGICAVTELQDLVYRDIDGAGARPSPPRTQERAERLRDVHFDTTLLFRYSALSFNGHRIHYDLGYATHTESYVGLVVHGPLLAQLLMDEATVAFGRLKTFEFRLTAPLIVSESAKLCVNGDGRAWVEGPDRRLCLTAQATT